MAEPRMLEMIIHVEDEGGPEDYNQILDALSSIGAVIQDEREI